MKVIYQATTEVRAAVVTSIATTIVSFLPVFAMQAQEGKLFHPLAFTKTFALIAAFILGIVVLPTLVHIFFNVRFDTKRIRRIFSGIVIAAGFLIIIFWQGWTAVILIAIGINNLLADKWPEKRKKYPDYINTGIAVLFATWHLSAAWLPLGAHNSGFVNFLFVAGIIAVILLALISMVHYYEDIIRWALVHKRQFLLIPAFTVLSGLLIWQGFDRIFGFVAVGAGKAGWKTIKETSFWQNVSKAFPGTGKEFMPSLNEGSFLLMPTTMPHTGIEKNLEYMEILDKRVSSIPEVEMTVGKWGRVNSALDPAPIQMFENTINYRPEYILDDNGQRVKFKTDRNGSFILKNDSVYNPEKDSFRVIPADSLIPDRHGDYFRQWRPKIRKPDDIWNEIIKVTDIPGLTFAP
jgi:Cu(I)/Ag(I) efflux system membrane protein CusA/SilA